MSIDLSHQQWGEACSIDKFINEFEHLSFKLPNRTLFKISLNVGAFRDNFARKKRPESTGFYKLYELIQEHQQTLEEISFNSQVTKSFHSNSDFIFMLQMFLDDLSNYPNLRRIELNVPAHAYIRAGEDGSKSFIMSKPNGATVSSQSAQQLFKLIDAASNFVGNNDVVSIIRDLGGLEWQEVKQISVKLQPFKDNLQILEMKYYNDRFGFIEGDAIWDFAMTCSNLKSFGLNLYNDHTDPQRTKMEVRKLKIPSHEGRNVQLKKLDLVLGHYEIDWKEMENWMGNSLEELTLIRLDMGLSEDPIITSKDLLDLLSKSRTTLRKIKLENLGTQDDDQELFTKDTLFFPNLESLQLESLKPCLYDFFFNFSAPNLVNFSFIHRSSEVEESKSTFKVFLEFLRKYSSQLKALEFNFEDDEETTNLRQYLEAERYMDFPALESLKMHKYGEWFTQLPKRFSGFGFSSLKSLDTNDKDIRSLFMKKSRILPSREEANERPEPREDYDAWHDEHYGDPDESEEEEEEEDEDEDEYDEEEE